MKIHELNTGVPGATAYVPLDDGTDTYKANLPDIDIASNPATFTSGDAASASSWTDVTAVTSGLSMGTLLNRITAMMKNVRFLYSTIGNTAISNVASTIKGAIGNTALGTTATTISGAIKELKNNIGSMSLNTSATNLTGAINEHESDINTINGKVKRVYLDGAKIQTKTGTISPVYVNVPSSVTVSGNYGMGIIIQYDSGSSGTKMYAFTLSEAIQSINQVAGATRTVSLTWNSTDRRYEFTNLNNGQIVMLLGGNLAQNSGVTIV